MMFRTLALVAFVAITAFAAPAQDRKKFSAFAPADIVEYLTSLTDAEKIVLKDLFAQIKEISKDEFLAKLKAADNALFDKTAKAENKLEKKVNALSGKAKSFAEEYVLQSKFILAQVVAGTPPTVDELRKAAKKSISLYKALPAQDQAQFKKQFPNVGTALETTIV